MRFLTLTIEGYKSFQQKIEIDFTKGCNRPGRNVYLIGGMNGAGKTSILEAIHLCLYGEKRRDLVLKAINRAQIASGNPECKLQLSLETDEGNVLLVQRGWRIRNDSAHRRPEDLEESLTIIKDGASLSAGGPQLWQEFLDTTVPRSITQFFFFDGEKIQEMAADEHAAYKLRSSLESALGIGIYRRLIDDLKHLRDEERRNRTDITDEDIRLKENELQIHRRRLVKLEDQRRDIDTDIREFSTEVETRRNRFLQLFGSNPDNMERARDQERQRVQLSTRIAETELQIRGFLEKVVPIALLSPHYVALSKQITTELQLRRRDAVRDVATDLAEAITQAVQRFEEQNRSLPLSDTDICVLRQVINAVVQEFSPEEKDAPEVAMFLNLAEMDAAKVLSRIDEFDSTQLLEFKRLLDEYRGSKNRHEEIEISRGARVVAEEEQEFLEQLQTEFETYSTQLGRKKEELRQLDDETTKVNDVIRFREKELDSLYQKHVAGKEQAAFLLQIEKSMQLMTQYMEELRKLKIGRLQVSTTEMYKRLASKGDLLSDIEIDLETYTITIRDHHGHVVQKQNLSAGEKEVFAISLLWGLAQTSRLQLPIVIDTPLSRLDSTHRDKIVANYFPEAGQQVIVLSTDTEIDQEYYRQMENSVQHAINLVFDKKKEFTTVQEGYFWEAGDG